MRWQWIALGPRPMNSCSKRAIPSAMAASISPCVFMAHLSYSSFHAVACLYR